jgi:tetratricopeptide (TPR) repeat protein
MLLYDFPISRSLLSPASTLLGFAAVAAMLIAAVMLARRQRLLSFSLLWFLGNLALESSFVPIEMLYEHRTYLPSMLPIVALVELALRNPERVRIAASGCLAVALLLSVWTLERNLVWSDELLLWRDNLAKTDGMPRVKSALAYSLDQRGQFLLKIEQPKHAQAYLEEAVQLMPDYTAAYINLGVAHARQGDFDSAIRVTRRALVLAPTHAVARRNLAQFQRDRDARSSPR